MAVGFMAIFAIAIEERVDWRLGTILLWPMTAIGVFSLLLWRWTDDLRLYAWAQFFPCLALPLIFFLFSPKFTGTIYWLLAAIFYALAKLFEFYDHAIYSASGILSGHTLKHFAAAAACGALLRYFQKRQSITVPNVGDPQELPSPGLSNNSRRTISFIATGVRIFRGWERCTE
jgi:hypothetical protein